MVGIELLENDAMNELEVVDATQVDQTTDEPAGDRSRDRVRG